LLPTPAKFRVLHTGETISKDQFDALNEIFDVYNAFNEFILFVSTQSRFLLLIVLSVIQVALRCEVGAYKAVAEASLPTFVQLVAPSARTPRRHPNL
jgi:hypothetical protein